MKNDVIKSYLLSAALSLSPMACADDAPRGAEQAPELVRVFVGSGCGGDDEPDGFEGLSCIRTRVIGESLTVDLWNVSMPCGSEREGSAKAAGGAAVDVALVNPGCAVAACGNCEYDGHFEIDISPFTAARALDVEISFDEGCEHAGERWRASMTLDEGSEILDCSYRAWGAVANDCGGVLQPCLSGIMCLPAQPLDESAPACDEGLVCEASPRNGAPICVPVCEADDDCPLDGVLSCSDGRCRPT
jgi:hypothetical protein